MKSLILFTLLSCFYLKSQAKTLFDNNKQPLQSFFSKNKVLEKNLTKFFAQEKNLTKKKLSKYLIKENYFDAKIIKNEHHWKINSPVKTIFVIKGNQFLNNYELNKLLEVNETQIGINFYENIINSIEATYQKYGFQQVKIKRSTKKKEWKKWIYFKITEGSRVRIQKINVDGLLSKPPKVYADYIIDNSSPIIKEGYYNKKDLELGYKNLIIHLKSQGYLSSKFYSERVIYKNNTAIVTVNLNEGPLTLIKNIGIKGNSSIPSKEILSHIQSRIQLPLKLKILEQDLIALEDLYKSKGFLNVKIQKKGIVYYEQKNQYAIITLNIQEGLQSRIANIKIQGNSKIKTQFILDLLEFKKGELLTPEKINQSINTLSSLDLFSRISINENSKKDSQVLISVKEKKSRQIQGGMGLNTERGLTSRAYIEYGHKNLFGTARSLFLKTKGQMNLIYKNPLIEYEISGIYQDFLIPKENILGHIGTSFSKDIFSYFTENINVVRKNQISFAIYKKSKPLTSHLNLWNLENRKEFCINQTCPEKTQNIGSSSFTFKFDNRNNIFNPTEGMLFAASGEYSSPYIGSSPEIQFWKATFQYQIYTSLSQFILAYGVRLGFIFSQQSIPVSRSFILGGESSIRGFDGYIEGERIPRAKNTPIETANDFLNLKKGSSIEKVSSTQFGIFKTEFRFPIVKNIKGLWFYDGGCVRLKTQNSQLIDCGHSTGFGFRYETLLIPIGLDIAYKLPPRIKGESQYRFHLSLGLF